MYDVSSAAARDSLTGPAFQPSIDALAVLTDQHALLPAPIPTCSINSVGDVGPMSRPGRPGQSCACGALIKSTNDLKTEGLTCNCKIPGGEQPLPACALAYTPHQSCMAGHLPPDCAACSCPLLSALAHPSPVIPLPLSSPSPALPTVHDALDPEMSILKQRIARRLRHEGHTDESVKGLDLGECQLGCATLHASHSF